MAAISATMVKDLRDKTGAGMMDCKKALVEANGDIEKAIENLRKSGIAKAEKKAGRAVKEGKVTILTQDNKAAIVEVLCETDFVATNDKFQAYLSEVSSRTIAMDENDIISEKVQAAENDTLVSLIATIGENMQIRRAACWKTDGKFASYLHMGGRIGVLVDLEGDADDELMKDICMHIAAFKPQYVTQDEISADDIEKEKVIAKAQVAGKPENIIDNIVNGKINKWFSEVCLMKQPWIRDDKSCLAKVAPSVKVNRFIRWEITEEA
jgi:elongation factor Ts